MQEATSGLATTPPPVGNTGVERTTGIDWVSATTKRMSHEEVATLLARWLGPTVPRSYGREFYKEAATLGEASMILWGGIGMASGTVMVSLAGRDLRGLGADAQLQLVAALDASGFRFTRIDAYVDDWARLVTPADVRAAMETGDCVTRTQGAGKWECDAWGWGTQYIGSRRSPKFGRVYDKGPLGDTPDANHRGVSPSRTRWELELKDHAARGFVEVLLLAGLPLAEVVWGTWRGFVDFRERGGRATAHGERSPITGWWEELTGSVEKVRLAVAEKVLGLMERADYLAAQVARTLATVHTALGEQWLRVLLQEGRARMNQRDHWQVDNVGPLADRWRVWQAQGPVLA